MNEKQTQIAEKAAYWLCFIGAIVALFAALWHFRVRP